MIYGLKNRYQRCNRLAVEKPGFARELIANPEKFKETFQLNDQAVEALKSIKPEDLESVKAAAKRNPEAFAEAVVAANSFLNRIKTGPGGRVGGGRGTAVY